jgi:hypothetical protein
MIMKKLTYLLLAVAMLCTVNTHDIFAQKKGKVKEMPKLDPNNPEDAIKMDRKITSSLNDSEDAVYWWWGNVYSRIPGEKDRLLFTYQAMNVRASKTFQDEKKGYGWRHVSRELLFYMDPQTKEIAHKWTNPFTGKEVEVMHVNNDPVNGREPTYARGERGDFKLRGQFVGDKYLQLSEVPLFYTNPLAGDYQDYVGGAYQAIEIFNFVANADQMLDATNTRVEDVSIAWTRVSKWLPWMEMGDRVGYVIFTAIGKKLKSWDELPEVVKNEIKVNYPAYVKAPPVDDTRPNETSWTVFKKIIDSKKGKNK